MCSQRIQGVLRKYTFGTAMINKLKYYERLLKKNEAIRQRTVAVGVAFGLILLFVLLSLHQEYSNGLTLLLATGGIMVLVSVTLFVIMLIRFDVFRKTNNQHLISHGYAQGIGLYTLISGIPAAWLLNFASKRFDAFAILAVLVILSAIVIGMETLQAKSTIREG